MFAVISPLEGALLAGIGALLIDLQLTYNSIVRNHEVWHNLSRGSWIAAEIVRIAIGAMIGYVLVATDQVGGGWGAFVVGASGPLLLERLISPIRADVNLSRAPVASAPTNDEGEIIIDLRDRSSSSLSVREPVEGRHE